MTSSLITVIIPVYNTEKYLDRCLDSVINQSLKDIEIICVDDRSTDNSVQIIQQYQAKDKRIQFIQHERNLGQGGARNTAILAANSDYIASVDSDDTMQPNMLEELWSASNQGEFDITCCGFSRVTEEQEVINSTQYKNKVIDNSAEDINIFTLLNPAIWNKLWRKSLFIDNDIFFPHHLYYQDMATIPLLVAKAKKIKLVDQCLYNYLVRPGSVTTSYSAKHIIDYFKVYEILFNHLKQNDFPEYSMQNLVAYMNKGLKFHAKNIIDSDMNDFDKKQYLQHLLMMKLAFFESFDAMSKKTSDEIIELLGSSISFQDISTEDETVFGVVPTFSKKLNGIQLLGIKMFGLLLGEKIDKAQKLKLRNYPQLFFKDSNESFTRAVGKLLNII